MFHRFFYRFVDSLAENDRVCARSKVFQTLANDCLCKKHGGRGPVAGNVVRFGGNFFHELSAHVFKRIGQFDFFCDRHAVVGDEGGAKLLVQDYVPAFGAQRNFYRIRKRINARFQCFSCVIAVFDLFCHDKILLEIILQSLKCRFV